MSIFKVIKKTIGSDIKTKDEVKEIGESII